MEENKGLQIEKKVTGLDAKTKMASRYTIEGNKRVYELLDFDDNAELENATRGLIYAPKTLEIHDEKGKIVWSQDAYSFLEKKAPDTANPSLWRNTQLNHIYGLFEVIDGIYQVRGYDMARYPIIPRRFMRNIWGGTMAIQNFYYDCLRL